MNGELLTTGEASTHPFSQLLTKTCLPAGTRKGNLLVAARAIQPLSNDWEMTSVAPFVASSLVDGIDAV